MTMTICQTPHPVRLTAMSEILPTYATHRPTGFDPAGAFLPDRQGWYVLPVSQTRDSGPLARSNFRSAVKALHDVTNVCTCGDTPETDCRSIGCDPECPSCYGTPFEVHRFGHWGPGWYEILIVDPACAAAVAVAEDIAAGLADYPVVDETDYRELEYETAAETWANMRIRERIERCRKHRISIFAARRDDMPETPTGEYPVYVE